MNVLVVNGSPHRNGDSARLAALFLAELEESALRAPGVRGVGCRAHAVDLYTSGIEACLGCPVCGGAHGCVRNDGMPGVLEELARADCLVLASPVHFSSLSGPMVSWISRLQAYWKEADAARRGVGVLLVCGGAEYGGMFDPARKVAAAAFRTLGRKFSGMIAVADTDGGGMDRPETRECIREVAGKVRGDLGGG